MTKTKQQYFLCPWHYMNPSKCLHSHVSFLVVKFSQVWSPVLVAMQSQKQRQKNKTKTTKNNWQVTITKLHGITQNITELHNIHSHPPSKITRNSCCNCKFVAFLWLFIWLFWLFLLFLLFQPCYPFPLVDKLLQWASKLYARLLLANFPILS